jgi:hypothetical protein
MEPTSEQSGTKIKAAERKIKAEDRLTLEERRFLRDLGIDFADVLARRYAEYADEEPREGEERRIKIIEMATEGWGVITDVAGYLGVVADDKSLSEEIREKLKIAGEVFGEFGNGMLEELKKAPEFKKVFKWPIDVPPLSSPPSETKK